ncbi:helix-turn-helix domain-containing protein [Flavobacterium gelidilacus]|uniref:helix-turn-helix domain-containing protein n=1 Tax=Flavobacterium gelidilacus TaxID=206041 RepID=UPI0003FFAAE1|nr:helix-turn-helix domain-containing protein [Flavobacterium gelidilacus]
MAKKNQNQVISEPPRIYREQLITVDDLNHFRMQLLEDIKQIMQGASNQIIKNRQWLKAGEVRKLLNISPGTLNTLRINGKIKNTKIGKNVYYNYDDINKLLNQ